MSGRGADRNEISVDQIGNIRKNRLQSPGQNSSSSLGPDMKEHVCRQRAVVGGLVVLMLIYQVSTRPVARLEDQSLAPQARLSPALIKRTVRMTPLWRIMGSKPHRAYCKNNYECSTGICWGSRCAFSHPNKS